MRYAGAWRRVHVSAALNHTLTRTTQHGASMRFAFTGSGVAVFAPRQASYGVVAIYVDGKYTRRISLASTPRGPRVMVYRYVFATGGPHTIEFRVVSPSGKPVQIDEFVVTK